MRRILVYLPEDIEVREVRAMAESIGCFVRHSCGMTVIDRIPGVVAKSETMENVVPMKTKGKR